MNAQIKIALAVLVLMVASFIGGLVYSDKTTVARLETDILELSKRNKSITARVNDLRAATERDAEASRVLAEGLAGLSSRLAEQARRSQSITERATRIDYLARVLDKGISELIIKVDMVQKRFTSNPVRNSN